MPVPELPSAVVDRFAVELRAAIARAKEHNSGASEYELADALGISRVQLRNLADGLADRSKGTPANPRLDTLFSLSRVLGLRIVIDASGVGEDLEVTFDEDALRRHTGQLGSSKP